MKSDGKLIRVTCVEYTEREGRINIKATGRGLQGEREQVLIPDTRPYCFIPEEINLPNRDYIIETESGYEGYDGVSLKKVVVKFPRHVNNSKEGSDNDCIADHVSSEVMYESDIPYIRRVSVDDGLSGYIKIPDDAEKKSIEANYIDLEDYYEVSIDEVQSDIDASNVPNIEPRVLMLDIEVNPPSLSGDETFQDFTENAEEPITAITTYDTYEDEYCVLVLDPEDNVSNEKVRYYLEDHWKDHDLADDFINADMRLVQCEKEEDLLKTFIKLVEEYRPDLLSGWNYIDFDHQYILNRLQKFQKINQDRLSDVGDAWHGGWRKEQRIDGLPAFDMMDAYCNKMTFHQWKSQSLDYVSNEELSLGKVEDVNIGKEYQNNRSRFLAYNIIDTQLLVAMDEQNGIHEFFYQLAELSSVQIYDTFSEMRLVDGFVMSRRDNSEILPSMEEKSLGKIAGGLVLTPSEGVNEWVATLDLKSLYPSIFITLNVSEETLTKSENEEDYRCPAMPESEDSVGGEITEEDIDWDLNKPVSMGLQNDHEGVLPKYLKLLFRERELFKEKRDAYSPNQKEYNIFNNKQRAIKVVMNSFYGVSQNPYYRLSTPIQGNDGIGSTITAGGRYVLWRGAEIMKEMGYDVKYGDTDSVLIQLAEDGEDVTPREVYERGKEVEERLNERMDEVADEFRIGEEHPYLKDSDLHGNDRHCLHWEFEKLYRRFLQAGTKKRYAGLPVWKEGKWYIEEPDSTDEKIEDVDPDITGFESNRADVLPVAARTQKKVIERVLAGDDFSALSDYISGIASDIKNLNLPIHEIAKPGVINKPLEEYGNTPTIRACRYSNSELDMEWREGDDPWIYYVKSTPPMVPDTDVIALDWGQELPKGFEIDKDKVLEKIESPLEPVLGETEWTFDELKTGRKMQGVETESKGNPFAGGTAIPTNNNDTQSTDNVEERKTGRDGYEQDSDGDEDGTDDSEESGGALSW